MHSYSMYAFNIGYLIHVNVYLKLKTAFFKNVLLKLAHTYIFILNYDSK